MMMANIMLEANGIPPANTSASFRVICLKVDMSKAKEGCRLRRTALPFDDIPADQGKKAKQITSDFEKFLKDPRAELTPEEVPTPQQRRQGSENKKIGHILK